MSRLRTLKPSFFTHEKLADLSPLHRLLFQGLWCHADREGRLEDRPRYLKTVILPYDECDLNKMLSELAAAGFVLRYEMGGKHYISIPKFLKHQKPHPRELDSEIPAPKPSNTLTIIQKHNLGSARVLPEQGPGNAEPGGLWSLDNGLGENGLGGRANEVDLSTQPTQPLPMLVLTPEEAAPLSSTPTPSAAGVLQEAWNCHSPPLPAWKHSSSTRDKSARARLKEHPDPAFWFEVCKRISVSGFCLGDNERGWKATPDWLLQPDTAAKVLEGKYDGRKSPTPPGPQRKRAPPPLTAEQLRELDQGVRP